VNFTDRSRLTSTAATARIKKAIERIFPLPAERLVMTKSVLKNAFFISSSSSFV
jgi:hypothetical protein